MKRCLAVTLTLAIGACGGPEGRDAGTCGGSGLTDSPQLEARALTLDTSCSFLPSGVCDGTPGLTCIEGDSGDQIYEYSAFIVSSAEGWARLASVWTNAATCVPSPPSDWTGTSLVLAGAHASSSCDSSASHRVMTDSQGHPHVDVSLDFDYCGDCDCATAAATGSIIDSPVEPTVCMHIEPY